MKTTKLAIGICGAVMTMAALAAPAPAQVSRGTGGGGGGGAITRLVHPIIYDYETAAPNPVHRRHLMILPDGAATLVDNAGGKTRVIKRRLKPADLSELDGLAVKGDVTAGAPVSRMLVRKLERIAAELAGE